MGVGDHQRNPGQTAGEQDAQERQPAAPSSEATSGPRSPGAASQFTPVVIRACTFTTRPSSRTFNDQGVDTDEHIDADVEWALLEGGDLGDGVGGHLRDLRAR
jgi:hypothetical protein